MAQKVEVTLVDDLDGGKADETLVFGLDGTRYVIDLSEKNAKKLRDTLAKYIEAARRDRGGRAAGRGGAARKPAQGGPNTSEVREWAKAQGFEVSERGRVSKDLIVKFQEAH
ncbi:Lsr2 family protein [Actinocrinis sp.]|uniref:histone-like nucleoid-structuring protein Lsr2 n=1 Tax=Actinocrinis sp. TaxID=1920516 RepID=UPI002D6EEFDF|nr:Lsr2 family protein [Actinocrinis sp.]HZP54658.1 Lsr2 family protein [Actinocrinis sp.]